MFCNQCGTQVPDHVKICPNCGADVGQAFATAQNAGIGGVSPVQAAQNVGMGEVPPVQAAQNAGMGEIPPVQAAQNAGTGQISLQQAQNMGTGMGYGQPAYGQPNQQMYGGASMPGYSMPPQLNRGNLGAAFKNAPGEFAGRVKRMGISVFCLLGIIAAMLFLVAPFMNFASIHVNEKVEIPSYYSYGMGSLYGSKVNVKAGMGFNLFELSQLSGTVERLADRLGGADTDDLADALEEAEDYLIHELEDEIDTSIKDSSVKEVFGTAALILKGRAAVLITPWILIVCGAGLLVFTVTSHRKLKLVFSLIPLACLIWLMICSGHFFSIMGIGAWAIILGIVLGLISAVKDA